MLAALGSGLMAGVFFAFSAGIMKALGRLVPASGIAAMQAINVAAINPVFLTAFLGTAVACGAVAVSSLRTWHEPGSHLRLAGSLAYLIGAFLVTIAFNIPPNNALAIVEPASADGTLLWSGYLAGWTAWNHVRAVAALAAAALLMMGSVRS